MTSSLPDDAPLVSIILPTYREAENLTLLLPTIAETLAGARFPYEIVIVDDNSRDGVVELCEKLSRSMPLRLLVRTKERGLATAVMAGVNAARGDYVVVMDADWSHPVEALPGLIEAARRPGVDLAIGSRYVMGGTTDDAWGLGRWLNSKFATWLARPLTNVSDPMSGFFAIRRDRWLAADPLDPVGYKIGLEIIVKAKCRVIAETPIHFHNRRFGSSKLDMRERVNYLRHLGKLYRYRLIGR